MKLSIPVKETIEKRRSIRTYENRALLPEDKEKLTTYMNTLSNPFDAKVNFHIAEKGISDKGEKLGTYGVIRGANTFLGVSIPENEFGLLAAGYEFENLILYATNMGLGTVWLAATFSKDSFAAAMKVDEKDLFIAISPVGYPSEKQSVQEKLMRKTMKASSRKPWEELFYKESFQTPLNVENAGTYYLPLEMLRLAPSATNAQPWRVLKSGNVYHFYETHKENVSKEEAMIKQVDLGIGIAHFHQTALEMGLSGRFEKLTQKSDRIPEDFHYLISWVAQE